jgi:hypothetical protein
VLGKGTGGAPSVPAGGHGGVARIAGVGVAPVAVGGDAGRRDEVIAADELAGQVGAQAAGGIEILQLLAVARITSHRIRSLRNMFRYEKSKNRRYFSGRGRGKILLILFMNDRRAKIKCDFFCKALAHLKKNGIRYGLFRRGDNRRMQSLNRSVRALSSVGRAEPLQGLGREFEPLSAHQSQRFEHHDQQYRSE